MPIPCKHVNLSESFNLMNRFSFLAFATLTDSGQTVLKIGFSFFLPIL